MTIGHQVSSLFLLLNPLRFSGTQLVSLRSRQIRFCKLFSPKNSSPTLLVLSPKSVTSVGNPSTTPALLALIQIYRFTAHLNLRDQYLPHKYLIGRVILDVSRTSLFDGDFITDGSRIVQKNKSLRTVVNKLDTIDNVYRNFQMEVLAGEPDFFVEMVSLLHVLYCMLALTRDGLV